MALVKLEDFYPNYRQKVLGGKDIQTFDVYAGQTDEKIGTVFDDVVDLTGRFRYLVIDTSNWGIQKKVLIPIGCCRLDNRTRRVYALGILNKKHIKELPEYADGVTVDYNYEEYPNQVTLPLENPPKSQGNQPTLPPEKIDRPPSVTQSAGTSNVSPLRRTPDYQ
ncbi:PRC-barrel domain-containing protein [Microcoleus sp. FACHB-672]|uniref:PRC-barrel domain-containing protein n=1 Tax=Microcoleus sp. FACHB-672 TaxID=2692825 RepID=UPI001F553744|nr:PRC-barrel domain-containing protein [Microcoleus sp. FACHB-672]